MYHNLEEKSVSEAIRQFMVIRPLEIEEIGALANELNVPPQGGAPEDLLRACLLKAQDKEASTGESITILDEFHQYLNSRPAPVGRSIVLSTPPATDTDPVKANDPARTGATATLVLPDNPNAMPGEEGSNRLTLKGITRSSGRNPIEEVRLPEDEGVVVLLFTDTIEKVPLHWEPDDQHKGYCLCNGNECPSCKAGTKRKWFYLLPVVVVGTRRVGVLRLPNKGHFLDLMTEAGTNPDNHLTRYTITRTGPDYRVESRPIQKPLSGIQTVIAEFMAEYNKGTVKLANAITRYTNEEMRRIPRIKYLLEGWEDEE